MQLGFLTEAALVQFYDIKPELFYITCPLKVKVTNGLVVKMTIFNTILFLLQLYTAVPIEHLKGLFVKPYITHHPENNTSLLRVDTTLLG